MAKEAWPKAIYGFAVTKKPIGSGGPLAWPVNLVLHTTEGGAGPGGDESAWETLHSNNDPSHFVVDSDSIIQCRSLEETGSALRHAADAPESPNRHAIQIEIAGRSKTQPWAPDDPTSSRVAAVMAYAADFHDIPLVVPNPTWRDDMKDIPTFPTVSIENSRRLWAKVAGRWPNARGVWEHLEVPWQDPTWHWDGGAIGRTALIERALVYLRGDDMTDEQAQQLVTVWHFVEGVKGELGLPTDATIGSDPAGNPDLHAGQFVVKLLRSIADTLQIDQSGF